MQSQPLWGAFTLLPCRTLRPSGFQNLGDSKNFGRTWIGSILVRTKLLIIQALVDTLPASAHSILPRSKAIGGVHSPSHLPPLT